MTKQKTQVAENWYGQISKVLKYLRKYHKQRQGDVAAAVESSKSHICDIERGKRYPSLRILKAYGELYEIPVSTIIILCENYGKDPRKVPKFLCKKPLLIAQGLYEYSKNKKK
jgi:transcriptional regulator with XRE-family HTH domain